MSAHLHHQRPRQRGAHAGDSVEEEIMKTYPLAGEYGWQSKHKWVVRPTGEFRPPRRGEWFLSGAIVEGYQAPNDLSMSYHIAKITHKESK